MTSVGGSVNRCTRRRFFESAAAAFVPPVVVVLGGGPARAQDHGRIKPPVPAPDIPVVRHDGVATSLPALLGHHVTALQVMFTSCTTTCPIQGAIFRRVQKLIPDQTSRAIQLVSLSVDPDRDDPEALTKWLRRFHARPGWIAASPGRNDTERLRAFAGRGRNAADDHSTQVQIINRDALLVWRTSELPDAEEIAGMLRKI
jgi:protein SCO1/2